MALGNVFMTDTDGNIGSTISSDVEKVCGLLFDISGQTDFWTKGQGAAVAEKLRDTVIEINSLDEETTPARLCAFAAACALAEDFVTHKAPPGLSHALRPVDETFKFDFPFKPLMNPPYFLQSALARKDYALSPRRGNIQRRRGVRS